MYQNLLLAQHPNEAALIKACPSHTLVAPFDLSTRLYCDRNNIPFVDFAELLDLGDYLEIESYGLDACNNYLVKGVMESIYDDIPYIVRFLAYQIKLVQTTVRNFSQKFNLHCIYVSGWESQTPSILHRENYVISEIAGAIFPTKTRFLDAKRNFSVLERIEYSPRLKGRFNNLIVSRGYRFDRLLEVSNKLSQRTAIISFDKVSFKTSIKDKVGGVTRIKIDRKQISPATDVFPIKIDNLEYANLLTKLLRIKESHIFDLHQRSKAMQEVAYNLDFDSSFSFATRGESGYLLSHTKKAGKRSVLIPHGTVAAPLDNSDVNYKSSIAEAVFLGDCGYLALQSKIAEKAYRWFQPAGEPLNTGNLIFASATVRDPSYILYAVTVKDFFGLQFIGVETYWEHLSVLHSLNTIAHALPLPIMVSLHPAVSDSVTFLRAKFSNLKFSNDNIQALLQDAAVTFSFSSTSIEDSLYSRVPVVLFDPWHRYRHHLSESHQEEKSCLRYINSLDEVASVVESLTSGRKLNFEEFLFGESWSENFANLLQS